ncbi:uncharacterized protein N7473_009074 [Penicillium subrubescens]|uniref:uncharacterized protein n=1 Tax=Penicillium subrubescens TaxID=1316194 RepID=UPI0025450FF1|nr:uncharacterized protein N7473_009074 [Penicillium subrubescens]KAJ5886400.1 hypothetical protein N7473_009074 [Penicillium subrubescens]
MESRIRLSNHDYSVGWICALPVETAAAKLMLDEEHPPLPRQPTDQNTYILGRIGGHNIVIASLPSGAYGSTSAATVGTQLLSSFRSIRIGLLVGIGGGVPSGIADIRLGDIVVSQPTDTCGGVIQYDLGKTLNEGNFQRIGMLNRPPKTMLTALTTLRAHHYTKGSRISEFVSNVQAKMMPHNAEIFTRPIQEDLLFQADYDHAQSDLCVNCDRSKLLRRPTRGHQEPVIHYGLIGSANQVVKDGKRRDQLAREFGIYCVDMEAAGLMNDFPCLVIRGICDYADSHKSKEWQGYAAAAAAAYAKELLLIVPIDQTNSILTARETLADRDACFNVPFNITAVLVIENFLGRQDELDQLWEYLRPTDLQSRKVAILHGLGGIGKTQLAIRFARDHKHDFTAIFWLSGKDRGTLLQSLSSILPLLPGQSLNNEEANKKEIEQRAMKVLRWLAIEGNSRWLIIFDNIDQYSPSGTVGDAYDIGEFFPAADQGSILITTRLQSLAELGKSFPINKLESNDAIQLLLQSSRLSARNTTPGLESDIGRLDGLPLAIVIAGAFMRETGINTTEYLEYYQESWSDLQLQSSPIRQYQQGNMLQTWMISYYEIKKRDTDAAKLLLLLAHFDNRDLCSDVPLWLKRITASGLAFNLRKMALIAVGHAIPEARDRNYPELQQRLIPHARHVCRGDWFNCDFAIWGAFHGLGELYFEQGSLKEAEEMFQRALLGREKTLSPEHTSTLDTVNCLGNLYKEQGKLREAEEMYQRALLGREKVLGPKHTSTLGTVNNIGNLCVAQGKLDRAAEMYQRALSGREKTLGPECPSTLSIFNNIGNLYRIQGKLEPAEQMYQRALLGRENALGLEHTSTLGTVTNLGNLYKDQGKLLLAEEMYRRALTGKEKVLGLEHMSTLNTVGNLGLLYKDQGKLKKAEEMYQRALAGFKKTLGSDHNKTRWVRGKLDELNIQMERGG